MPKYMRQTSNTNFYKYTLTSTSLLETKSPDAAVISIIPANSRVEVIDAAEDWYQVIYNYETGFVPTSRLSITEYAWQNTVLHPYADSQTVPIATIPAKSQVQVLSVVGDWSYVIYNTQKGYIFTYYLTDDGNPPEPYNFQYFETDMTRFVNENNIKSPTPYLITTDLTNKLTYVFNHINGRTWNLLYQWSCTVGKPSTPTIRGTFFVNGRKPYLGSDSYRVKYATRILESYYYHTVLFDPEGNTIINDTLGEALSHGCIRLAVENAQWVYDNVLDTTTIVIN